MWLPTGGQLETIMYVFPPQHKENTASAGASGWALPSTDLSLVAGVAEGVATEEVEDILVQGESGGASVQRNATKTQGLRVPVVSITVHSAKRIK